MTEEEIISKAQSLVDGKRFVKIHSIWDYKPHYLDRGCLERRSGGIGIAMPKIPLKEGQPDEYRLALKIIKEVYKIRLTKGIVI